LFEFLFSITFPDSHHFEDVRCRLFYWQNQKTLMCGLALILAIGCGAKSSQEKATVGGISGKVTFGGEPVTEGQVVFRNTQLNTDVVGVLDESGAYSVSGVVVGKSLVSVQPLPPPSTMDITAPKPKPANPENIPKKYRSPTTSKLEIEVGQGNATFNIDMSN